MKRMMRSARLVAPRRWELLEQEIPEPVEGTMLVRLRRTAICGTDKPCWVGLGGDYPLAPGTSGHEAMGVVAACPSGRYAEGEQVSCSTASTGPSTRSTAWPPTMAAASACPPMPSPRWCS